MRRMKSKKLSLNYPRESARSAACVIPSSEGLRRSLDDDVRASASRLPDKKQQGDEQQDETGGDRMDLRVRNDARLPEELAVHQYRRALMCGPLIGTASNHAARERLHPRECEWIVHSHVLGENGPELRCIAGHQRRDAGNPNDPPNCRKKL